MVRALLFNENFIRTANTSVAEEYRKFGLDSEKRYRSFV